MACIDKCLIDKKIQKRKREIEAETRQLRVRGQRKVNQELTSLSEMMDSNKDSSWDDEFQVPSTSTNVKKPKKIINILTVDVVASLDRVNLFDRNGMFVVVL